MPARKILEAVKAHQPVILGLSALLTVTMPKMGEVIQALKETGLRNSVKVIIGGTSVTPEFARKIAEPGIELINHRSCLRVRSESALESPEMRAQP